MNNNKEIYYTVKLRQDIEENILFTETTCSNGFSGKLVNQNGRNFYFELNGSDAIVIIPHAWIDWMVPQVEF